MGDVPARGVTRDKEPGQKPRSPPSRMDVRMSGIRMTVQRIYSGSYTRGQWLCSTHLKKSKRRTRTSGHRTTSIGWHLSGPLIALHFRQVFPRMDLCGRHSVMSGGDRRSTSTSPRHDIQTTTSAFTRPARTVTARQWTLSSSGSSGERGLAQLLGVSIRLANPPDECPGGNRARISSKFAARAGAQRATVSWPYVKTPRVPHDAPPQFHIISVSPDKRGCTRLVLSMHALMVGPSTANQANGWYPPVISLGSDDPVPPQPARWTVPQAQSSYRVDTSDLGNRSKLRKVERACDHCRKRKAKCDGPQRKDHICSSCEAIARTCTYLWVASSLSLFMR